MVNTSEGDLTTTIEKMKNVFVTLGVAASAGVIGLTAYSQLAPNPQALECNAGIMRSCELLIDSKSLAKSRKDLNTRGNNAIKSIIDQRKAVAERKERERIELARRRGENLQSDHSRIVNSKNEVSKDMRFTATHFANHGGVNLTIRWFDGIKVIYNLSANGTGYWVQEGVDMHRHKNLNWSKNGDNLKITNDEGAVIYLGGIMKVVDMQIAEGLKIKEQFDHQQAARAQREREDMIRREEMVKDTVGGIGKVLLWGLAQ